MKQLGRGEKTRRHEPVQSPGREQPDSCDHGGEHQVPLLKGIGTDANGTNGTEALPSSNTTQHLRLQLVHYIKSPRNIDGSTSERHLKGRGSDCCGCSGRELTVGESRGRRAGIWKWCPYGSRKTDTLMERSPSRKQGWGERPAPPETLPPIPAARPSKSTALMRRGVHGAGQRWTEEVERRGSRV